MDNTINVNPYGDGECWDAILEKLIKDLKTPTKTHGPSALWGMAPAMVTTVFNIAHELGYKLVKA